MEEKSNSQEDSYLPKTDKNYKNYVTAVDKALKNFEYSSEWPDLISALTKLNKVVTTHTSKYGTLPRNLLLYKRLSQCLHPNLPSGVHLKALETYELIYKCVKDLDEDFFSYSAGLLPLWTYASMQIRPILLNLTRSLIPHMKNALEGFLIAILSSDNDESSLLHEIRLSYEDFTDVIWLVLKENPKIRLSGLNYVLKYDLLPCEALAIETIMNCLSDDNILVQRAVLELVLKHYELKNVNIDKINLLKSSLKTLLKRDMSLNRRFFSWLIGDNSEYFEKEVKADLIQAVELLLAENQNQSEVVRILISLLDKVEVNILDDILVTIVQYFKSNSNTDTQKVANLFFVNLEPEYVFSIDFEHIDLLIDLNLECFDYSLLLRPVFFRLAQTNCDNRLLFKIVNIIVVDSEVFSKLVDLFLSIQIDLESYEQFEKPEIDFMNVSKNEILELEKLELPQEYYELLNIIEQVLKPEFIESKLVKRVVIISCHGDLETIKVLSKILKMLNINTLYELLNGTYLLNYLVKNLWNDSQYKLLLEVTRYNRSKCERILLTYASDLQSFEKLIIFLERHFIEFELLTWKVVENLESSDLALKYQSELFIHKDLLELFIFNLKRDNNYSKSTPDLTKLFSETKKNKSTSDLTNLTETIEVYKTCSDFSQEKVLYVMGKLEKFIFLEQFLDEDSLGILVPILFDYFFIIENQDRVKLNLNLKFKAADILKLIIEKSDLNEDLLSIYNSNLFRMLNTLINEFHGVIQSNFDKYGKLFQIKLVNLLEKLILKSNKINASLKPLLKSALNQSDFDLHLNWLDFITKVLKLLDMTYGIMLTEIVTSNLNTISDSLYVDKCLQFLSNLSSNYLKNVITTKETVEVNSSIYGMLTSFISSSKEDNLIIENEFLSLLHVIIKTVINYDDNPKVIQLLKPISDNYLVNFVYSLSLLDYDYKLVEICYSLDIKLKELTEIVIKLINDNLIRFYFDYLKCYEVIDYSLSIFNQLVKECTNRQIGYELLLSLGMNFSKFGNPNKNEVKEFQDTLFKLFEKLNEYDLVTLVEVDKLIDIVYTEQDKERVQVVLGHLISSIISTNIKDRTTNYGNALKIIKNLSQHNSLRKSWKKEVFDLLLTDTEFFAMEAECLEDWKVVMDHLFTMDRTSFSELLTRVSVPNTLSIFTSKDTEYEGRAVLLKRLAFVIWSSEGQDQFCKFITNVQERLAEALKTPSIVPIIQKSVFLCFRVIIVKFSSPNLSALWPIILHEIVQVLVTLEEKLGDEKDDGAWLNLALETFKLIELLTSLKSESVFQMYKWAFVSCNSDNFNSFLTKIRLKYCNDEDFKNFKFPCELKCLENLNQVKPFLNGEFSEFDQISSRMNDDFLE